MKIRKRISPNSPFWSGNVTTSTREPPTCAWISAEIWRQDGAICSNNRKIVPYHRCTRSLRLTVSIPDYGFCRQLKSGIFTCCALKIAILVTWKKQNFVLKLKLLLFTKAILLHLRHFWLPGCGDIVDNSLVSLKSSPWPKYNQYEISKIKACLTIKPFLVFKYVLYL